MIQKNWMPVCHNGFLINCTLEHMNNVAKHFDPLAWQNLKVDNKNVSVQIIL